MMEQIVSSLIFNLTIESVTNANVLSSSVPFQSSDLYLTGLSSTNKSILTKISILIPALIKLMLVLIDLYNNGGGGGGGTFSGAATSLQFGSSSINLPSVIGTNGQTLLYIIVLPELLHGVKVAEVVEAIY